MGKLLLIAAVLVGQTQPAVRRTTPASNDPGMVVRQAGPVVTTGQDGGSLPVSVTATPDYGLTAFGNARTAEPFTLYDSNFLYGVDAEEWGTRQTVDSGIHHLPNESAVLLVANADGGVAALRTHSQFRYQSGKGARILMTGAFPGGTDAGQVYRLGYFDDNDGLGWKYSASGLQFFVRTSTDGGVSETLYQVDAGPGWVPANGSIYETTFQWLGVGEVRAYLNGNYVVDIRHANTLPQVYMKTATLPLTYEAVAGSRSANMKAICTSVQSEGGAAPPGHTFSDRNASDLTIAGNAVNKPAISIRVGGTFNGQRSRIQAFPTLVWCSSESKRIRVDLILNPNTLPGATFATAATGSGVESDVSATGFDGGVSVGSFGVASNTLLVYDTTQIFGVLRRNLGVAAYSTPITDGGFDRDGTDTLTIAVTNTQTGNASVVCGVDWVEIR